MSLVCIEPPAPHSLKQRVIQQFFLDPYVEEIFVANGTKWGKTIAAASAISLGSWEYSDRHYRWIAPMYKQSQIGLRYCQKMLPPQPYIKVRRGSLEIDIVGQNTLLDFYHSQDAEALEGYAVNGYVFDEAAKQQEDAYLAARTTQSRVGNKRLIISTPLGKNWFYRRAMEAKEEMLRAVHEKRMPKKIFITAPTADNPTIPRENIESARRDLPDRLFRQYYLAEFIDEFNVFNAFRRCLEGPMLAIPLSDERWSIGDAYTREVVIGADWAKHNDYTVFIALCIKTRRVVGFWRFTKCDYTESIGRLVRFSDLFAETHCVYHDKTGVGEAIDEQLGFTSLPYHGIVQTNAVKNHMVNKLITGTEQTRIILPRWSTLELELDSYEIQTTKAGNFTYAAPSGATDDVVSALMIGYQALEQYSDRTMTVRVLEDLHKEAIPLSPIEQYYQSLISKKKKA